MIMNTEKSFVGNIRHSGKNMVGLGAGLLGFVYTAGMLDAYEQLVENEKYTRRLLFKLRKKVRTKIEQM